MSVIYIEEKRFNGRRVQCLVKGCRKWTARVQGEGVSYGVCPFHMESGLDLISAKNPKEVRKAKLRRNTLSKREGGRIKPRPKRPNSRERRRLKALGIRWQDRI